MSEVGITSPREDRVMAVFRILDETYPEAKCELIHTNAYELLVSVILSAQCTDTRVNLVTPALFAAYPTVQDMAEAPLEDLESLIYSTGFYRSKAKSLQMMAQRVVREFGGEIPDSMDALTSLRGVARKTANVVLGDWFGKQEGFIVDTHVLRLTKRLGWTRLTDPRKVERVMMRLVPSDQWTKSAHLLVFHGRRICTARKPNCADCPVAHLCPKIGV